MRIGADCLEVTVFGDQAIGRANETVAKPFAHGLHAPVLPKERMAAPSAKIGNPEGVQAAQVFDFFPQLGHGARIEDL